MTGKSNSKSAAIAGLTAAGMGATSYGAGVLGNKSGLKVQRELKKKNKKYREDWKKKNRKV